VHGVQPRSCALVGIETQLTLLLAGCQSTDVENLRQLGSVVEHHGTDVLVELLDRLEFHIADSAVEVRRLQDEARIGSFLQQREQSLGQVELGNVIDLHVGVDVILCEVEDANTESSITDESVKSVEF